MIGEEMVFYQAGLRMFGLKMFFGDVRLEAFSLAGLWKFSFQIEVPVISKAEGRSVRIHYLPVSVIWVDFSISTDLSEQGGVFLSDFAV